MTNYFLCDTIGCVAGQYAGVAQWQSSWFVISRLMVRLRSPAPRSTQRTFYGRFPEWPKGADCKSVASSLRWSESTISHQQKQNICLPANVLFLFIQAAGLVYHHRAKRGAYHQPLWGCISSRAGVYIISPWLYIIAATPNISLEKLMVLWYNSGRKAVNSLWNFLIVIIMKNI